MARSTNEQRVRRACERALRDAGAIEPLYVDVFLAAGQPLEWDVATRSVPHLDDAISAWKAQNPGLFAAPAVTPEGAGIAVASSGPVTISVGIALVTFLPGQRLDGDAHLLGLARHFGIPLAEG